MTHHLTTRASQKQGSGNSHLKKGESYDPPPSHVYPRNFEEDLHLLRELLRTQGTQRRQEYLRNFLKDENGFARSVWMEAVKRHPGVADDAFLEKFFITFQERKQKNLRIISINTADDAWYSSNIPEPGVCQLEERAVALAKPYVSPYEVIQWANRAVKEKDQDEEMPGYNKSLSMARRPEKRRLQELDVEREKTRAEARRRRAIRLMIAQKDAEMDELLEQREQKKLHERKRERARARRAFREAQKRIQDREAERQQRMKEVRSLSPVKSSPSRLKRVIHPQPQLQPPRKANFEEHSWSSRAISAESHRELDLLQEPLEPMSFKPKYKPLPKPPSMQMVSPKPITEIDTFSPKHSYEKPSKATHSKTNNISSSHGSSKSRRNVLAAESPKSKAKPSPKAKTSSQGSFRFRPGTIDTSVTEQSQKPIPTPPAQPLYPPPPQGAPTPQNKDTQMASFERVSPGSSLYRSPPPPPTNTPSNSPQQQAQEITSDCFSGLIGSPSLSISTTQAGPKVQPPLGSPMGRGNPPPPPARPAPPPSPAGKPPSQRSLSTGPLSSRQESTTPTHPPRIEEHEESAIAVKKTHALVPDVEKNSDDSKDDQRNTSETTDRKTSQVIVDNEHAGSPYLDPPLNQDCDIRRSDQSFDVLQAHEAKQESLIAPSYDSSDAALLDGKKSHLMTHDQVKKERLVEMDLVLGQSDDSYQLLENSKSEPLELSLVSSEANLNDNISDKPLDILPAPLNADFIFSQTPAEGTSDTSLNAASNLLQISTKMYEHPIQNEFTMPNQSARDIGTDSIPGKSTSFKREGSESTESLSEDENNRLTQSKDAVKNNVETGTLHSTLSTVVHATENVIETIALPHDSSNVQSTSEEDSASLPKPTSGPKISADPAISSITKEVKVKTEEAEVVGDRTEAQVTDKSNEGDILHHAALKDISIPGENVNSFPPVYAEDSSGHDENQSILALDGGNHMNETNVTFNNKIESSKPAQGSGGPYVEIEGDAERALGNSNIETQQAEKQLSASIAECNEDIISNADPVRLPEEATDHEGEVNIKEADKDTEADFDKNSSSNVPHGLSNIVNSYEDLTNEEAGQDLTNKHETEGHERRDQTIAQDLGSSLGEGVGIRDINQDMSEVHPHGPPSSSVASKQSINSEFEPSEAEEIQANSPENSALENLNVQEVSVIHESIYPGAEANAETKETGDTYENMREGPLGDTEEANGKEDIPIDSDEPDRATWPEGEPETFVEESYNREEQDVGDRDLQELSIEEQNKSVWPEQDAEDADLQELTSEEPNNSVRPEGESEEYTEEPYDQQVEDNTETIVEEPYKQEEQDAGAYDQQAEGKTETIVEEPYYQEEQDAGDRYLQGLPIEEQDNSVRPEGEEDGYIEEGSYNAGRGDTAETEVEGVYDEGDFHEEYGNREPAELPTIETERTTTRESDEQGDYDEGTKQGQEVPVKKPPSPPRSALPPSAGGSRLPSREDMAKQLQASGYSANGEELVWYEVYDETSGYMYYQHVVTGESQWEPPAEGYLPYSYAQWGSEATGDGGEIVDAAQAENSLPETTANLEANDATGEYTHVHVHDGGRRSFYSIDL